MKQRAIAVAIATVMVAAGLTLSVAPAAAMPAECDHDFPVADSEQDAKKRNLSEDQRVNGIANVSASDGDQVLKVRLETANDVLAWQVFEETLTGCEDYTAGGCNGENTISSKGSTATCTLQAPVSGTTTYYVGYLADDTDDGFLEFSSWLS